MLCCRCNQCHLCLTQDEKRMDKLKKRLDDLELIRNNIKLLSELLSHYRPESSDHEKQLIQVCLWGCFACCNSVSKATAFYTICFDKQEE